MLLLQYNRQMAIIPPIYCFCVRDQRRLEWQIQLLGSIRSIRTKLF